MLPLVASLLCSCSEAGSQTLPTRATPAGMRSLATGGSGSVFTTVLTGSSNATAMAQALVRGAQPYFGGTMRVLHAIGDRSGTQIQASFSAKVGAVPVIGLLGVATDGGAARAVLIFDGARTFPRSIDRLVRVATSGGTAAGAAPAVEPLTRTRVPDGSGTIDLGPGWVIRHAQQGAMDIQGPIAGSGMSLGAVLTVPFTSADPAEALVAMARQMGRAQGQSIDVQIIDQRPIQWQQGGRASLLRYRTVANGQRMEYFGLIAITPYDGQQVFFYSSYVQATAESFARVLPTAMRSWATWSIYPSVLAQRMQQTAQTMRETGELLAGAGRGSQRAFDGVNAGWGQYIRGVATLEDPERNRSEVDQSFAENVVRSDPQRFRIVPTSELVQCVRRSNFDARTTHAAPGPAMPRLSCLAMVALVLGAAAAGPVNAQASFDIVIRGGRVIDPESRLDAIRDVGIRGGRIAAVSAARLRGQRTIDATGLVVSPGFIDLHAHGQDDENYRLFAVDGVTTALELEAGTADVPKFYADRVGKALINFGAATSHIKARMTVMRDGGIAANTLLPLDSAGYAPASDSQISAMRRFIDAGLAAGGLGVGMGLQYTPVATKYEVLEAFRSAARVRAPVFVHTRSWGATDPGSSVESVMEVIAASAISGAPVHIVHLNSVSLAATPRTLAIIADARSRGIDVTTEAYPYIAGMTELASPLLDRYANGPDSLFSTLMLARTGERLTRATFLANRKPGEVVILFVNTPEMEAMAITSPLTAIASDGRVMQGVGHPRAAGTFARVLSHYVRDTKQLTLAEAIRKMTLLPAQRLEALAPVFRNKGRIRVGADADISIFDPATVADRSTYLKPATASVGFRHVLVNGVPVVANGEVLSNTFPGRGARAPVR
jgi:N-acyl-D-aspartate/D-glutamate deacylase